MQEDIAHIRLLPTGGDPRPIGGVLTEGLPARDTTVQSGSGNLLSSIVARSSAIEVHLVNRL